MDSPGLSFEVGIESAKDDTGVNRSFGMETTRMPAIERNKGSPEGHRVVQHGGIGIALIGLAVLENG